MSKGRHCAPRPSVSDTAGRMAAVGVTAALPIVGLTSSADAVTTAPNWGPIIACESGGQNVHTAVPGPYTASGYFQITNGTWAAYGGLQFAPTAMQATLAQQTVVANRIFAASGYGPWNASKGCWGSKINSPVALPAVAPAPAPVSTPPRHALAAPITVVLGSFASPVVGVITQGQSAGHAGLDIAAPLGTPEFAAANGVVINAGTASGYGLWVRIRTADGVVLTYGHMDTILVHVGQSVAAGQKIATVGARGNATGPHLHFQVNAANGAVMNALSWLLSHGISPTGGTTGRHAAPVPAPAAAPVAPAVGVADTGRDSNGFGSYICDAGHLYFDACDPNNIGQRVNYPAYDR